MVLVDTSIWISLYRRRESRLGELVWALVGKNEAAVCGQVWVEFIGGFRRKEERRDYARGLESFPWLDTNRETYGLAAELLAEHRNLGSGDAIIAATAMDNGCALLTTDGDFRPLVRRGLRLAEL